MFVFCKRNHFVPLMLKYTQIPRPCLLLGQVGCKVMLYPREISPWEELFSTALWRHSCPASGVEIRRAGTKILSWAHLAVWLRSSPPHPCFIHSPRQHPQTPMWLIEKRRETIGVVNGCATPWAEETRSCSVRFQLPWSLMSPQMENGSSWLGSLLCLTWKIRFKKFLG